MSAIGQLVGYGVGSINTVSILGTLLGDTQFKQMTLIAALFLIGSVLVTSYSVKERILITARLVDSSTGDVIWICADKCAEIAMATQELFK